MANHTCPSRLVENNNVKLTHNWGQPPRKPPECEHMQSALKRRKALSFLSNQHISKFSNISTRVNAERKIKHLKTQVDQQGFAFENYYSSLKLSNFTGWKIILKLAMMLVQWCYTMRLYTLRGKQFHFNQTVNRGRGDLQFLLVLMNHFIDKKEKYPRIGFNTCTYVSRGCPVSLVGLSFVNRMSNFHFWANFIFSSCWDYPGFQAAASTDNGKSLQIPILSSESPSKAFEMIFR